MKVLLLDHLHEIFIKKLTESGFDCNVLQDTTREGLLACIPEYHGIIVRSSLQIDKTVIDAGNILKFIGRAGAGLENIDVEYAREKGIRCFKSPEGNRSAVAEHALGMLLALFNKIIIANRQVNSGKWAREENRGMELAGKTIGIIGYGNTGSAFAQRLQGFDVNVIAYDKYKTGFGSNTVKECTMQEIFETAGIISLHVPLTSETTYLVDDDFIGKCTKNIYLINTSRGKVVKTKALVTHLHAKKIAGACLDVLEYEDHSFAEIYPGNNPDFDYLTTAENVLLTPHIAGWTHESKVKIAEVLAEKIIEGFGKG